MMFSAAGVMSMAVATAYAQELPPCGERQAAVGAPWTDTSQWCIEQVIADDSAGELAFAVLAVGDDGTLYAARPLTGQVLALVDTDDDYLPDSPHIVAKNLTFPTGLAFYDGALYISGGEHIYRLINNTLDILVDDLPTGAGFWTVVLAVAVSVIFHPLAANIRFWL